MDSTEEQEKKLAKQKAMGALFLSHQVAQLEKSVDSITFSRDSRLYKDSTTSTSTSSSTRSGGGNKGGSNNNGRGSGGNNGKKVEREIRIVDASALIHALPLLKRYIREDKYLLIVPLEVISTLDELKKSPQPLKDLGKEATRFLETYFDIARQILSESTSSTATVSKTKPSTSAVVVEDSRIRLRPQQAHEELSWLDLEKRFKVPEGYIMILPEMESTLNKVEQEQEVEGEEEVYVPPPPLPNAFDIPKGIRSSLQCGLWFQARSITTATNATPGVIPSSPSSKSSTSHSSPTKSAFLTYPTVPSSTYLPSFPLHCPPPSDSSSNPQTSTNQKPPENQSSIASGNSLIYFASTFLDLNIHEISKEEVLIAKEWARGLAREKEMLNNTGGNGNNGNGRNGGGRGGRGSDRGGRGGNSSGGNGNTRGGGKLLFVP